MKQKSNVLSVSYTVLNNDGFNKTVRTIEEAESIFDDIGGDYKNCFRNITYDNGSVVSECIWTTDYR